MSAAHTPGPWLFGRKSASSNYDKSSVYRVSGDHMVIADVRSSEDDARLIAAAPQLAEALRAVAAYPAEHHMTNGGDESHRAMAEIARAALTVAGVTP